MRKSFISVFTILFIFGFTSVVFATSPYAPFYFQNITSTYTQNTFSNTINYQYYPFKIYTLPVNGVTYNLTIVNLTITNVLNPNSLSNVYKNAIYNSNTILSGNIIANNITIDSGVYLTSNGFDLVAEDEFNNLGVIKTGLLYNNGTGGRAGNGGPAGNGTYGISENNSYGGSGGGGASGYGEVPTYSTYNAIGGNGGNTLVIGGKGSTLTDPNAISSGSIPTINNLNNQLISNIFGIRNELGGAGGGGGGGSYPTTGTGGNGGSGAYGIYIQANILNAGTINASGINGQQGGGLTSGLGGGGGGGTIILAYNSSYISGNYLNKGGLGGANGYGWMSSNGGNGGTYIYNYKTPPVGFISPKIFIYSNVANFSYIPPPSQMSYTYNYLITEMNPNIGSPEKIYQNITYVNMTDMNGQLTYNSLCSQLIQDTPNCALFPFGTNVFTQKPTQWYIQNDEGLSTYNGTGSLSNFVKFSNNNVTFTPQITLIYNQFTPSYSFQLNLFNNPKVQTSKR